jgi:F-type H+/Na+-transporting ATPase subunit alpha
MTQAVNDSAETLLQLDLDRVEVLSVSQVFKENHVLYEALTDPAVTEDHKDNVLDGIAEKMQLSAGMQGFLKDLCKEGKIESLEEIFERYFELYDKEHNIVRATLIYAEENLEAIKAKATEELQKFYPTPQFIIEEKRDDSLLGGYKLSFDGHEYDASYAKQLEMMQKKIVNSVGSINSSDIISLIKSEIEGFDEKAENLESGQVIWVGDGIVTVHGIDHAVYGEVVQFENGIKGMVQDIRQNEIGIILFGRDTGIHEGSMVYRTGKRAGVPVGNAFCGRVVNALGEPMDGLGEIAAEGYLPVESEAPGIIDRQSVDTPMATGILSIDSMFPIGRGQRELIIGDRQTGKTSIATDTIINQKGNGVICVYVAIGQKASTVAKVVSTLKKHDAMDYSIVVASTASDPASLQYIAPYAGTSIAEFFMHQGKDVLIVYDDLSKHAVAYRAISLLLERSPGREAYPGDVFYLHSRLLERSSRLSDALGGGSITALPIIETQSGDVSAYIPTNVISITDGQIYLESNLFNEGQRPAVNVGLSVSRVGGAAQTKAMKKASGTVRIDLAQYREMEVFTQFASDLDDATKAQLAHGRALMELLKQPLSKPLPLHKQIQTLVMATHGIFDHMDVSEVKKMQGELLEHFESLHAKIGDEIEESKQLTDEMINEIVKIAKDYLAAHTAEEKEAE